MKIDLMRRLAIALGCFATVGAGTFLIVSADDAVPVVSGEQSSFNPFAHRLAPRPAEAAPLPIETPIAIESVEQIPIESGGSIPLPAALRRAAGAVPVVPGSMMPNSPPSASTQVRPVEPTVMPLPRPVANEPALRPTPPPQIARLPVTTPRSTAPVAPPVASAPPVVVAPPTIPQMPAISPSQLAPPPVVSAAPVVARPEVGSERRGAANQPSLAATETSGANSSTTLRTAPAAPQRTMPEGVATAAPAPVRIAPVPPVEIRAELPVASPVAAAPFVPRVETLPPVPQPERSVSSERTSTAPLVRRADESVASFRDASVTVAPYTGDLSGPNEIGSAVVLPQSPLAAMREQSVVVPAGNYFTSTPGPQESMGEMIFDEPLPEGAIIEGGDGSVVLDAGFPSDCCRGCPSRTYAIAEAILFRRESQGTLLNASVGSAQYDYELGGRATIGRRGDCVNGWEASFMTTADPWAARETRVGAGLNTYMTPVDGLTHANISAFNGASFQELALSSRLYSLEINRLEWGWDVLSTSFGLRYIQLEDQLRYTSVRGGETGTLQIATNNHLIGPQIGSELFYDIGGRVFLSGKGKLGAFLNANDQNSFLVNTGPVATTLQGSDSQAEFAALGELQMNLFYKLTRNSRLRAGYEMWYLYGVATSNEQYNGTISPLLGRRTDDNDDIFMHGASVGFEWVR